VAPAETARSQLATLAVSVELAPFAKVKEMMDKMVADLKEQQAAEVNQKAYCEKEFDQNEKSTYKKTEEKEDLEAEIESLGKLVEKLTEETKAANEEKAATELAIKKASQNREVENTEFQTTVADQRATQAILKKALDKLKQFYKKSASLLQKDTKVQQEPPVKFNEYKTNAGASPVIGLIEQIIEDSKALEAEATTAETDAQKTYETFVKDSNAVIEDLTTQITTKTQGVASAQMDNEENAGSLSATTAELESLSEYKGDLHMECDFVLANFAIRQKGRLQEMEAIQSAKAILSGAA
jgi:DNA repair exonuclease SbcCD ATPase subunit